MPFLLSIFLLLCRFHHLNVKNMTRKSIELNLSFRVNDRATASDVNDGDHLVLYRRRPGRLLDESSFVSTPLRTTILRTF